MIGSLTSHDPSITIEEATSCSLTGAVLLAQSLARLGIKRVHAAPGTVPQALTEALCHKAGVDLLLGSNARTSAWVAVGSATRGQLACCIVAESTGALQALPALKHALVSGCPVLLVCLCKEALEATRIDEALVGTAGALAVHKAAAP